MTQRYYGTAIILMILGLIAYLTWSPKSGFYPRYNYYDDPYASTRFCNATNHNNSHNCGEQPDLSSARTVYSAHSADQYRSWYEFERVLEAETNALATSSSRADEKNKKDRHVILFYGDSITEAMRGTAYGRPCLRCQGLPDVARDVFSSAGNDEAIITPMFLGISGDQTQHVLYRIAQNEAALSTLISSSISSTTTKHKTRLSFVILIGTNNLSVGMSPLDTARGIRAVAQSLSEIVVAAAAIGHDQQTNHPPTSASARSNINNNVRILLLHVLPRGDDARLQDVCPNLCRYSDPHHDDGSANRRNSSLVVEDGRPDSFLPWIAETNGYLVDSQSRGALPPYVELLDCNAPFYSTSSNNNRTILHEAMFVDRLHPNVLGTRRFTECVMASLKQSKP
jgi:hypothetical protein